MHCVYVKTHQVQQGYKRSEPVQPTTRHFTSAAHVLTVAKNKQQQTRTPAESYADKCRYCQQNHWSDECGKYRTISAKKTTTEG